MRAMVSRSTTVLLVALTGLLALAGSASSQEPIYPPVNDDGLVPVELDGFGDPDNSWVASMAWYKDELYVGTLRSAHCVFAAALSTRTGFDLYPPAQSDCPADPRDLALAAEIWRYDPADESWELAYASPEDVPLTFDPMSGLPDRFTARDIAFGAMTVHVESDGTEALYVGGASPARAFGGLVGLVTPAPPPRLLRTVDGETFAELPHDPGTFLGSLADPLPGSAARPLGFTGLVSVGGSLFALVSTDAGAGAILSSSSPASGNDAWLLASPPPEQLPITAIASFNGALYVGASGFPGAPGHGIGKAAVGRGAPLSFFPVLIQPVTIGPRRVISMSEHDGRLYAGTAWPPQLIRVDPDDTTELVVGGPVMGLDGPRLPLAGIASGFGNPLNAQFTTMSSHDGSLYVGTMDASVLARFLGPLAGMIDYEYGFDLLRSEEGIYWYPVTRTGLGSDLQYGAHSLASTPAGLFAGTGTGTGGAQVWSTGSGPGAADASAPAPERLEAASTHLTGGEVVLSWEPVPDAVGYHVYRSTVFPIRDVLGLLGVPGGALDALDDLDFAGALCDNVPELCILLDFLEGEAGVPGPFVLTAGTTDLYHVETQPTSLQSIYFVRAELADGSLSPPSNIAGGASTAAPITFPGVVIDLQTRRSLGEIGDEAARVVPFVRRASHYLTGGNLASAERYLGYAERLVEMLRGVTLADHEADDLCMTIYRLRRNARLAGWSLIPMMTLFEMDDES